MMAGRLAPLALALLVASCDRSPTEPPGPVAVFEGLTTLWTDPPALSEIAPGGFVITATMPFPCLPYVFRPDASLAGTDLTVEVEGRYKDGCHQDVTGTASFRVTVSAVPAGTYEVRLVLAHREWDLPPDTLLFGTTVVP